MISNNSSPHFCVLLAMVLGFSGLQAEPIKVLTTFAPIDSLTRNVVGDVASVQMLLPPGVGPHDFSFSPGDLKKIAEADVIVMNGLHLEEWLEKPLKNSAKKDVLVIDSSKDVKALENLEKITVEEEGHHHDHSHGHGHDHGDVNPHIWLDPILASAQVAAIRDGLSAKDPANADTYKRQADAFIVKLAALDEEIRATTDALKSRKLLTFHDAFVYYANRYGFEVVGVFQPFPGKEPSPKYLKKLKDTIEEKNVRVLFSEPQYSPSVMTSLAKDLNVPIAVLDTMETGQPSADLYENTQRANLNSLKTHLNAQP